MSDLNERFPRVEIRGGPMRPDLFIDGQRPKGVTAFKLSGNVNDVMRLKTYQIVRAEVSIEAELEHAAVVAVIEEGRTDTVIARATADTVWEALADCARQLELQAKRDTGVAPGGTMTEPTGRPPGL